MSEPALKICNDCPHPEDCRSFGQCADEYLPFEGRSKPLSEAMKTYLREMARKIRAAKASR